MKDKIIIDGITYVRADKQETAASQSAIENVENMCFEYNGIMYEDDVMILAASIIASNDTVS